MLHGLLVLFVVNTAAAIWPPPRHYQASGSPIAMKAQPVVTTTHPRLETLTAGIGRFSAHINNRARAIADDTASVSRIHISLATDDLTLNIATLYNYTLKLEDTAVFITAATVYGALYGLETFLQLVDHRTGILAHSTVHVADAPAYPWRGLMIDSGRRFVPVPTLENVLDTMAANKMNVLHLHASDMCRFGVESKLFPNLTAALTGVLGGYYTQADIAAIVAYAQARGIRVVPEFDVPGHSRGFLPIENLGINFCDPADATRSQLFNDAQNSTYNILHALFEEMTGLFPDEVFHIGCDETSVVGTCSLASTFALERLLLQAIQTEFNKTPAGWEEVLFDAGAATQKTIVDAWSQHNPAQITATGRQAIESAGSHFYFTEPVPGGPAGWSPCWYNISTDVPSSQLPLLLGGEASMWTDTYCYIEQCGAYNGAAPVGSGLFSPERDAEFAQSLGGMIWPRGFVAAASFWNWNASADPASAEFSAAVFALNDDLQARGALTCPSNCSCDQLTACNTPYIKPEPPVFGASLMTAPCAAGAPGQGWTFSAQGTLQLIANASLCVGDARAGQYPLVLGLCAQAAAVFQHVDFKFVHSSGACLDLEISTGELGLWACGTAQPNQAWAIDAVAGIIVSLSNYADGSADSALAGECVAVHSSN